MVGLDKIKEKILSDARAEADAKIAKAKAEAKKITDDSRAECEAMCSELNADAEREGENIIARAKSAAAMNRRNILMEMQSRAVDRAFDEAKKKILTMPDNDYMTLMINLITRAFADEINAEKVNREVYGETDMPDIDVYEVIMNREDKAKLGRFAVEGAKAELAKQISYDTIAKLKLSDKTADIDGGIILKYGDVEINNSLSTILQSCREEYEGEVCRVLFD